MSVQAMTWALQKAPVGSQYFARLLLATLADYAHPDGTAAFPSVPTLMDQLECSESVLRKSLKALESQGIIRRGDQSLVERYAPNRRPVVWDLCMDVTSNPLLDRQKEAHEERIASKKEQESESRDSWGVNKTPQEKRCDSSDSDFRGVNKTPQTGVYENGFRGVREDGFGVYGGTPKPITKPTTKPKYPSPPTGDLPTGEDLSEDLDFEAKRTALEVLKASKMLDVDVNIEAPSRRAEAALRSLDALHGSDEVRTVLTWALTDNFWLPVFRKGWRRIIANFETMQLQHSVAEAKTARKQAPEPKREAFVVTEAWVDSLVARFSDPGTGLRFRRRLLEAIDSGTYGHPKIAAMSLLSDFEAEQSGETPAEPSRVHNFRPVSSGVVA
ncbi:MAG: helix-turn-helix domain-containing protein [Bifidobacteriaceae bacterium]|jgi:hypothetical protein|nr:helix-turn-helix domain-containing protein [Bifidobacteriaceae bacterium]MCI1914389.1 helix-turn-helix domain-containing protein [Bifidobacteriaceae bacterium]MCI1935841.1 helix-turn-helix domain-containing protein [Bifidobacteriaceae bacterium]